MHRPQQCADGHPLPLQIDIIDTFRRKVLQTDSVYCLKGYNALFEPAPFRHGIVHSPVVEAATARAARQPVAQASDVEQGLQSSPGSAKRAAPAAASTARDGANGAHSTAAAAQTHAAERVRGARDGWAPEWSAPVPRSYCFSPSLVPRPADWPAHVNAVGFCRDPNAGDDSNYMPPPELEAFLAQGPKPVYIGFGSMTIDDPEVRATLNLVLNLTLTLNLVSNPTHAPDPRSNPSRDSNPLVGVTWPHHSRSLEFRLKPALDHHHVCLCMRNCLCMRKMNAYLSWCEPPA